MRVEGTEKASKTFKRRADISDRQVILGRDITPVVRTLGVAVDPFRQHGQYCILQSRTSN